MLALLVQMFLQFSKGGSQIVSPMAEGVQGGVCLGIKKRKNNDCYADTKSKWANQGETMQVRLQKLQNGEVHVCVCVCVYY